MTVVAETGNYERIAVRPINPVIGAEITGIDLRHDIDDPTTSEVMSAIFDHLVVFFPDQKITPDEQVAFARHFGDVSGVPDSMFQAHTDNQYVSVLENNAENPPTVNNWHSDYCFAAKPDFLSILHTQIVPDIGGDTIWVNMYAAYEALSDKLKVHLRGLRANHDFMKLYTQPFKAHLWEGERHQYMEAAQKEHPPVLHPVVRTIPETGRQALFVNESFTRDIEGFTETESTSLLNFLFDHIQTPEYQIRYQWKPNTLAVWDNRVTVHYALADYHPQHRLIHRVTVLNHEVPA
jgi:taurine dioxygenase